MIESGLDLCRLSAQAMTLEEIFVELTTEEEVIEEESTIEEAAV